MPPSNGTCPACHGIGVLEATDIFCGAGGSSLGLEAVCCPLCGRQLIRVTQAINHWPLAVEAHAANFQHADHDVHDVEVIPASRFRRTPILWASPECTHHAYCRGPKAHDPEAQRSRATFADIVRFTEFHRYDGIIVENVIEARLWCDVPAHGEKCSCGTTFNEWYHAMLRLGYEGKIIYFNSQFALPTPQSRDRMYIVFWRDGIAPPQLDLRPSSWCTTCNDVVKGFQRWKTPSRGSSRDQDGMYEWGRYGSQYVYACPVCNSAVAPAVVGARTIIDWDLPATRIGDREKDLAPKTRERIRAGLVRLSGLQPVTVQVGGNLFERRPGVRVWSLNDPLRTVVGTSQLALVVPVGGQTGQGRNPKTTDEPIDAVTTENHRALIVNGQNGTTAGTADEPVGALAGHSKQALILRYGGQQGHGRSIAEPMQTVIGSDREVGLVVPNREHAVGATVDEPAGAITTAPAQHMLVQINRGGAGRKKVDRNADPLDIPTRTIAGHGELGIVEFRRHSDVKPIDEPVGTVTGGGYHHGLLVYNGNPGFAQSVDQPAGTVTSRDKQSVVVPLREITEVTISEDDIDDCYFRMLQWRELLRAQQMHVHFDGRPYELTAKTQDARGRWKELSNEQRVIMIGNAVSSPVATVLGFSLAVSLAPSLLKAA